MSEPRCRGGEGRRLFRLCLGCASTSLAGGLAIVYLIAYGSCGQRRTEMGLRNVVAFALRYVEGSIEGLHPDN
jgi:hypothetical protein